MKRTISLFLIFTIALCLFGCARHTAELQNPVRFYYPRSNPTYGAADSVIAWEEQEAAGHTEDYLYLLRQYMKGPKSDALSRTFPRSVVIKDLQINGGNATVLLNDYASLLSGLDLTMACACLTATVCELTGVSRVTIQAEDALLDGNSAITMDRSHILLLDESAADNAK